MTPELAVDLVKDLLRLCLVLCGPILAVALVIGLVSSVFQATTQIQENTLSFVPKWVAVLLATVAALPWIMSRLTEYTQQLFGSISDRM